MNRSLAFALAITASTWFARAQDDATRAWARETYARAEQAFERGEHEVALGLFRALVERTGNQSVRYSVAACLEHLGRRAEAYQEYQAVSEVASLSAEVRAAALEAAMHLHAELATLVLDGPQGARAQIDGLPSCQLPCETLIEPGAHRVALGERRLEVEVSRGERRELALGAAQLDNPGQPPPTPGASLGWLSVVGAILIAAGIAGTIGFGLSALDDHARFQTAPTVALARDGSLMRDLCNASLAVAGAGAILFAIDVALFATWSPSRSTVALGPFRLAF